MSDDGEVLFGGAAIAEEIARLTGKPISSDQAYRWAKNGTIPAKKAGAFVVTTKTALRESFQPRSSAPRRE
jgi:hypothetical protein